MTLDGDNEDDCKLFDDIVKLIPDIKVWYFSPTYGNWVPRSPNNRAQPLNPEVSYYVGDNPDDT